MSKRFFVKEFNIQQSILFLINPLLSVPGIIYGISKKNNFSIYLFIFFICYLNYLYVPNFLDDRTRYYEYFIFFQTSSWTDIFSILALRPDSGLQIFLSILAKIGLSFQFTVSIICFITLFIPLYIFLKLFREGNKHFLLSFFIYFFSIHIFALFSGLRFYLASSFVLLSYYQGFYLKSLIKGCILLLLASLIHFSVILFFLSFFLFFVLKKKPTLTSILFIISLFFLFFPKEFIYHISSIPLWNEGYTSKIDSYLNSDDILDKRISMSKSVGLIYWGGILWLYFLYLYLLFTIKIKSMMRSLLYCNIFVINFFYQITTVFERYSIILQLIAVGLIIYESIVLQRIKILYFFLVLFTIRFIFQLIIMRNNILASYFCSDTLLFITAMYRKITENMFLQ